MMSLSISVVDAAGKKSGSVELPADIFDAQTNIPLIHQVVVAQRAAARQGTHKAKTRGEVSGGGKKPFKQKGTGRARQGSTRAVQMRHGGVAHGPVPRSYDQRTPKKMKSAALRGALSDRARNGRVHVITEVLSGDPSTKQALAAVSQFSDVKGAVQRSCCRISCKQTRCSLHRGVLCREAWRSRFSESRRC